MRKILLFAAALLTVTAASAKTWRINYNDNAKADFKTIAEALKYKDFQNGDVLYIEPGIHSGSTEDNSVSKPCTIIGSGWGFRQNSGNDLDISSTCFTNTITISSSDVTIRGIYSNAGIEVTGTSTQNVIIERNRINYISTKGYSVTIKNNYIYSYNGIYHRAVDINSDFCTIIGNFIFCNVYINPYINQALFDHNTVVTSYSSSDGVVQSWSSTRHMYTNNIFINTDYPNNVVKGKASNMPFYNNVFSITPETVQEAENEGETLYTILSTEKHNKFEGATTGNTFTCKTEGAVYDPAMYYQVKEGAAAKTADDKGGECGAFGGDSPYVLNGRPQGVPYLYDVDVPQHPTNNELIVNFKIAGQNE